MMTSDMPPAFLGIKTIGVHASARKGENSLVVSIKNEIVERFKIKIAERNVILIEIRDDCANKIHVGNIYIP